MEEINKDMRDLLEQVLDDATADSYFPDKRVWPIRSSLYRRISDQIGYEYKSDRANMSYEDLATKAKPNDDLKNFLDSIMNRIGKKDE